MNKEVYILRTTLVTLLLRFFYSSSSKRPQAKIFDLQRSEDSRFALTQSLKFINIRNLGREINQNYLRSLLRLHKEIKIFIKTTLCPTFKYFTFILPEINIRMSIKVFRYLSNHVTVDIQIKVGKFNKFLLIFWRKNWYGLQKSLILAILQGFT